jgi:choline-glycine betaine transporter
VFDIIPQNTGTQLVLIAAITGIAKAVQENIPVSLFVLLENFPFSAVTSMLAILVIITFASTMCVWSAAPRPR